MLITDSPLVWDSANNQTVTETDVYSSTATYKL